MACCLCHHIFVPLFCPNREVQFYQFWSSQSGVFLRTTGTSSGEGNGPTFWMPREWTEMKSEVMSGRGWKRMSSLRAVTDSAASAVEDGNEKQSPKLLTLVIVKKDERVLLGMKKRGFGAGYFSGFGGKVEAKETIVEAAVRELQEECGVIPLSLEKRGILTFHFDDNPQPWEAHVYSVVDYAGAPCETEEMAPGWFSLTDMPYEMMWEDNPIWYPEFLCGRLFKGDFYFHNTHTLVSHALHVLQNLDA